MALYTGRILMRIGNEAAYDIDKLMPGEWAVSTDKRIVRICVSAGIGIRMATYEAFEEDMDKIAEILNQCQTIREAIVRINTEVSEKADAVAEYTEQAKQYRDEAEQYRDEAEQYRNESFSTTPEGYESLVKNVSDNTVKIDTVIQKAELNIKNTASGESIHLTDASDNKAVAFALCGTAKQYTGGGKNILEITTDTGTYNGITRTVNSDKSISLDGTSTISITSIIDNEIYPEESGMYKLTGSPSNDCCLYVYLPGDYVYKDENKTVIQTLKQGATNKEVEYYLEAGKRYYVAYTIPSANITLSDITIYPMLRPADTDDTYEPYTGGLPIPSPDYPQEIEVSGVEGNVKVSSFGKNWLKNNIVSQTLYGITITVNENKSMTLNGTTTGPVSVNFDTELQLERGKTYVLTNGIGVANYPAITSSIIYKDGSSKGDGFATFDSTRSKITVTEDIESIKSPRVFVKAGVTLNNVTIYPMVRLESDTEEYEPYRETVAAISTPNSLAGIPVAFGGNYTDIDGQQWICDEIVKYADGSGERIQRIKRVIYDGVNMAFTNKSSSTINNIFFANTKTTDFKKPVDNNSLPGIISSHFLRIKGNAKNSSAPCIYASTATDNIYFAFGEDTEITTVALANEWLKANNVTVYYELAEPIRTPLTAEEIAEIEKLQTFYPITNITNDSDCGMKVTYIADSKNYIDNQLALQAQAQEAAMINMLLLLPEETQAAMIENDTNNLLLESEE